MNIEKRRKLKYIFHWSAVLLLIIYLITAYLLPFDGVDVSWLFPEIKLLILMSTMMAVVGLYFHRCDLCNRQMYGWVTTRHCGECEKES